MYLKIDKIPALHSRTEYLSARHYNRIRLGLIRAGGPLRLELAGLRGMDIILDRDAWICVDRTFYDLPVLAWEKFETTQALTLHAPVRCRLHHYHINADFISATVMAAVLRAVKDLAAANSKGTTATVVRPFPGTRVSADLIRAALATATDDASGNHRAPPESSPASY